MTRLRIGHTATIIVVLLTAICQEGVKAHPPTVYECRCEYPGEEVYSSWPRGVYYDFDDYVVDENNSLIIPRSHQSCRFVQFVCQEEDARFPLFNGLCKVTGRSRSKMSKRKGMSQSKSKMSSKSKISKGRGMSQSRSYMSSRSKISKGQSESRKRVTKGKGIQESSRKKRSKRGMSSKKSKSSHKIMSSGKGRPNVSKSHSQKPRPLTKGMQGMANRWHRELLQENFSLNRLEKGEMSYQHKTVFSHTSSPWRTVVLPPDNPKCGPRTQRPTIVPTISQAPSITPVPTIVPVPRTSRPTATRTGNPTFQPSTRTPAPSLPGGLTSIPTGVPTSRPSIPPVPGATSIPTGVPTSSPSVPPVPGQTNVPTSTPTTGAPTGLPTELPTLIPGLTATPTQVPTVLLSEVPSEIPSEIPSNIPSTFPSPILESIFQIEPVRTPTRPQRLDEAFFPSNAETPPAQTRPWSSTSQNSGYGTEDRGTPTNTKKLPALDMFH